MFLRAFSYAPPEFARLGISGITYLGIDFLNKRHGICGWLAYTSSAVVVSMRTWLPRVVTYFAAKHGISIARGKTLVLIGICCYEYDLLFLSKQICHRCAIPLSLLLTSTMVKSDSSSMMIIIAIAMTRHLISFWILILRPPLNNLTWT